MEPDKPHPIIDRPHEFDLGELHLHTGLDGSEAFLDLHLQRDSEVRRLRFFSPRNIEVEGDGCFPQATRGMEILDVRHRQLGGIGVRVGDCEASRGSITFWARDVIDLDTNA